MVDLGEEVLLFEFDFRDIVSEDILMKWFILKTMRVISFLTNSEQKQVIRINFMSQFFRQSSLSLI